MATAKPYCPTPDEIAERAAEIRRAREWMTKAEIRAESAANRAEKKRRRALTPQQRHQEGLESRGVRMRSSEVCNVELATADELLEALGLITAAVANEQAAIAEGDRWTVAPNLPR